MVVFRLCAKKEYASRDFPGGMYWGRIVPGASTRQPPTINWLGSMWSDLTSAALATKSLYHLNGGQPCTCSLEPELETVHTKLHHAALTGQCHTQSCCQQRGHSLEWLAKRAPQKQALQKAPDLMHSVYAYGCAPVRTRMYNITYSMVYRLVHARKSGLRVWSTF